MLNSSHVLIRLRTRNHRPRCSIYKGNIQRSQNQELDGDAAFDTLDFAQIYHDDPVTPQNKFEIHDRRMAEVMIPRELSLAPSLKAIFFRTRWDLETFRFLLEKQNLKCPHRVQIEQITSSLYMHKALYIRELTQLEDKIHLSVHKPSDHGPVDGLYQVKIVQSEAGQQNMIYENKYALQSNAPLIVQGFRIEDSNTWNIELEGVLAFRGRLPQQSEVF